MASLWNSETTTALRSTGLEAWLLRGLLQTVPSGCPSLGGLNSGTYNNQWMVLDYKLFTPRKAIGKNVLWILEQMPNLIKSEDLSEYLQKQSYWASYNVPFFPAIFNISGQPDMVKEYGNYYSHDISPRAQIF
uniref:Phospholipase B-like n=1 Tax=Ixodes ricinus TaxID=34613 RepID=A0A0K8RLY8_IXORI